MTGKTHRGEILTPGQTAASAVVRCDCRVVVHALHSEVARTKSIPKRQHERRSNDASNVACLGSTACKDESIRLADAVDDIIICLACRTHTLAAGKSFS